LEKHGHYCFGKCGDVYSFWFSGLVFPPIATSKTTDFYIISAIVIVEALQYFTRMGIFEVDDIILNTFGAYTGWLLCRKIEKRFSY